MMKEIHDEMSLRAHVDEHGDLSGVVVQDMDLSTIEDVVLSVPVHECFFLGCGMSHSVVSHVRSCGGYVFPCLPKLPFNPFRSRLYRADELFDSFDLDEPCSYCDCLDARVYQYWKEKGKATPDSIIDGMYQRLHDEAVSDAMHDFIETQSDKKVVAIMGGHGMGRDSARYRDIAMLSRKLSGIGYLMVSGGGPGAMEATHLGAMLVDHPESDVDKALEILSSAPTYRDKRWLAAAHEVLELAGAMEDRGVSLGIPTWHYGHEPPSCFATHIAKYFSNSLREEGLITIAHDGIVFAPGSAGTIQEIFQDAAQNHYTTTDYASPMIFLDRKFWIEEKPVYPILESLAKDETYGKVMGIADSVDEVVELLKKFKRIRTDEEGWSFCDQFCREKNECVLE